MSAVFLPDLPTVEAYSVVVCWEIIAGTRVPTGDLIDVLGRHQGHRFTVGIADPEGVLIGCDSCGRLYEVEKVPYQHEEG